MSTNLDLHGVVRVSISDRVHRNVKESIARQLALLDVSPESASIPESPAPAELRVEPLEDISLSDRRWVGGPAALHGKQVLEFPGQELVAIFEEDRITLHLGVTGVPINPWLQFLLVPKGITMVHAAAVERDGNVLLLPAFGGAGKTLSIGLLVRDHGYKFLGDDIVLLHEDGRVLSFPRPLFFYDHHLDVFEQFFSRRGNAIARYRLLGPVKRRIVRGFPFKPFFKSIVRSIGLEGPVRRAAATREYIDAARPQEVFPAESLGNIGKLERVAFLQRYDGKDLLWVDCDVRTLERRVFGILHNEWTAEWPRFVAAGGYGLIDLPGYYAKVASILRNGFKNSSASTLMIPTSSNPRDFVEELIKFDQS